MFNFLYIAYFWHTQGHTALYLVNMLKRTSAHNLGKSPDSQPCVLLVNDRIFFLVSLGGVRLSPLGTSATVGLLYQPQMMMIMEKSVEWGLAGETEVPVPLCPPQIPHDLTWDRTRAASVGSQRLTAWAMARPPDDRIGWYVCVQSHYLITTPHNIHQRNYRLGHKTGEMIRIDDRIVWMWKEAVMVSNHRY
jgi:hypothetical protein